METITWNDFEKVTMRIGTIIEVKPFVGAKKPAYRLTIDFGSEGIKNSSAQITALYNTESLVGQQVAAVINFPPKQIGNFFSECLVLGVYNEKQEVVLLQAAQIVNNGDKIG